MRIGIVAPPDEVLPKGYGGIERFCYALAGLVAAGHDVTLVGPSLQNGRR